MISFDDNSTPNPLTNFCIRDYVFSSRNNNVAYNWPFSQKTLQICSKNGVKNLLPPFESHESPRKNSSNEEIIRGVDGNSNPELTLESKDSTNESKLENKGSQENFGQPKSKKPVLVSSQNLSASVERIEEVTHMASKVCPVCKTYSSSSNTALNAHIDQCLSGESSMKRIANTKEIVKPYTKPRIKPRKTRLMSDIYKTAPHCTVEELDERNGRTSWFTNSTFPAQELEFQGQEEETEATTIVPEVAHHQGDVYIDKNGTKVRILSVPKVTASNDRGARKLLKRGKLSEVFTAKKKNKHLKLSPRDKKLCSRNPSKAKTAQEENDGIDKSCEDDQVEKVMNRDDYPIVRPPWACSKRTFLAKRANLRTPLPLLKPSYIDSCLVKRSKVGSTGSEFGSSKKKLLLVSTDSPSKLHFRSKKSVLKKSSVPSLTNKNVVAGPTQDSAKRVEEDTSIKPSFMSTNAKEMNCADLVKNSACSDSTVADIAMQDINPKRVGPVLVSKPTTVSYMVSEELQGNSSSATVEQLYYDMSDSPISTISNPILAKSDSDKFSVRSSTGFLGALNDKYTPVVCTGAFKNDRYCCCSSKERDFSPTVASGYQESTHLKKRAIECFNFEPFLSNYPTSEPPKPLLQRLDSSPPMKLVAYNECDSAVSPSKPVLRLMGKNLTVVNTDDGQSQTVRNEQNFPSSHTLFPSTPYADYFSSPQVGPMVPQERAHEDQYYFSGSQVGPMVPQVRTHEEQDYFSGSRVGPMVFQDRAHENHRNRFDHHMAINEMNPHKPPSNSINDPIIIDDSPENDHTYTPFGSSGIQACSPFGKWYRTPTAGSSGSSAM